MNDIVNAQALASLGPVEARLAAITARPKVVAVVCVVGLTALGWGACGLMLTDPARTWTDMLCRPSLGHSLGLEAMLLLAMWMPMTLAMMLPSAAPMILTYAEIADTAVHKGERVVSPLVLTAGYLAVWLGVALAMTPLQVFLMSVIPHGPPQGPALLAATSLFAAGLYQFSRLKQACLSLCQRPFQFFFVNWTDKPQGVFALGLRQGLYCLGCCWALMLVMFAVGIMNVVWMAILAAIMTIEKLTATARFSGVIGAVLIAMSAALVISEFR